MFAIRHLLLLCGYGALAVAAGILLPQWAPGFDGNTALLAAAIVLVGGGLLHEVFARLGREGELTEQLLTQRRAFAELEEELTWTRREIKAVREAVETVARAQQAAPGGGPAGEVVAELKVLKSLLGRLADTRGAGAGKARAAPAEAKAAAVPGAGKAAGGVAALPTKRGGPARKAAPSAADGDVLAGVREAIRDDRVLLNLQPIVVLPQRKHRAYECFSRLMAADGTMLMPEQYIAVSEQAGLITAIDNMLLFRCIQLVRKIQNSDGDALFFCNISPDTLADDDFFGDFVDFLESNRELAPNLVFEFTQADAETLSGEAYRHLDRLAAIGCRFSLDRVQSLDLDAEQLARRNVRFVKIEAALLLARNSEESLRSFQALKSRLGRERIAVIVEKIEDEQTLVELLDYGIELGQGYLFGEPRPAKMGAEAA